MHEEHVGIAHEDEIGVVRALHRVTRGGRLAATRLKPVEVPESVWAVGEAVPVGRGVAIDRRREILDSDGAELLVIVTSVLGARGGEGELGELVLAVDDSGRLTGVGVIPVIPEMSVDSNLSPSLSVG